MNTIDNVSDLLSAALELERIGREFYCQAVDRVPDKVLGSVLLGLMHDEEAHERMITQYYNAIQGGQGWPVLDESINASELANEKRSSMLADSILLIGADSTFLSIYETALELELKSRDFYQEHLNNAEDRTLRKFLEFLVGVETVHISMIELILKATATATDQEEGMEESPEHHYMWSAEA